MGTAVRIAVPQDPAARRQVLQPAADAIRAGALVVFPTETVYGIAGCADDPDTLARIYAAKRRSVGKPFAYHIGSWLMLDRIAGDVPDAAMRLLRQFWPGPVTFLLDVGGVKTGFRFPDCAVACELLDLCNVPVMASSANLSGMPSPTCAEMTVDLWPHVAYVVDAGPTARHGDSTVVDLSTNPPTCIRQGVVPWPVHSRKG